MPALHEVQSAVAGALLGGPLAPDLATLVGPLRARLDIHRHTAESVCIAALRSSFPACRAIVGDAFFDRAASRFWQAHPPRMAWLGAWGAEFPRYLARLRAARGLPYLGDVARFEWALHAAAIAPEATKLTTAALMAIPADQHATLRFVPHPSVSLLRLRMPADTIVDAVLSDDEIAMSDVDLNEGPVHLVVYRSAVGSTTERVAPEAAVLLRRLFGGMPLGRVLANLPPTLDAAALLARQITAGRLAGVRGGTPAGCA